MRALVYVGVTIVLAATGLFVTAQFNLQTFTAGEVILADEVNQNFQTLAAAISTSQLPVECQAGEVAKWDGAAWACAQDAVGEGGGGGDITAVMAGTGLAGGGTSGDVTLALDTAVTDARYYQQAEVNAAISAAVSTISGAEVVTTPGVFLTTPPTAQRILSTLNESFSTTQAGRLLVSKYLRGRVECAATSARYYFITVDGQSVRNSTVYQPNAEPDFAGTLTGTTEESIPAGAHTLGIGARCHSGEATGEVTVNISVSSVVVLRE